MVDATNLKDKLGILLAFFSFLPPMSSRIEIYAVIVRIFEIYMECLYAYIEVICFQKYDAG